MTTSTSATHTSPSLLSQVRDPQNQDAWRRFDERYRPMITHFCSSRFSMSVDQAEEAAQSVLVKLVSNLRNFKYERSKSFRGWLSTVTRNSVLNAIQRSPKDLASGGSEVGELLRTVPTESANQLESHLSLDLMRTLFEECEDLIKQRVNTQTWNAFVMLRGGATGEEVAQALDMKIAAVYRAKTRVLKFFREEVENRLAQDPE